MEKVSKNSAPKILSMPAINQEEDSTIAIKTPTSATIKTESMVPNERVKRELTTIPEATEESETQPEPPVNPKSLLKTNLQTVLLPRTTIPETVSLLKKKFHRAYKFVVVKDSSPNQVKYYLYPNNKAPSNALSLPKKTITPTSNNPASNMKASDSNILMTWKTKENDHKKLVEERFVNRFFKIYFNQPCESLLFLFK